MQAKTHRNSNWGMVTHCMGGKTASSECKGQHRLCTLLNTPLVRHLLCGHIPSRTNLDVQVHQHCPQRSKGGLQKFRTVSLAICTCRGRRVCTHCVEEEAGLAQCLREGTVPFSCSDCRSDSQSWRRAIGPAQVGAGRKETRFCKHISAVLCTASTLWENGEGRWRRG